jgi:hypothetical protein
MVTVPIRRVLRAARPKPQPEAAAIEELRRRRIAGLRVSGVDQSLAELIAGDLVAAVSSPAKHCRLPGVR